MAKLKKRRGGNPESLLMEIERAPHRREAVTILLGPNRVASMPPIREKRR